MGAKSGIQARPSSWLIQALNEHERQESAGTVFQAECETEKDQVEHSIKHDNGQRSRIKSLTSPCQKRRTSDEGMTWSWLPYDQ
jgi:hypothetical protein